MFDMMRKAFITQEEVNAKTGSIYKSFFHIESRVEATEPEEIGVEHLLREIKEIPLNSLESSIVQKVQALRGLSGKIEEIVAYLRDVKEGKLPANNKIMFLLQEIINLLPNLNSEELIKSFAAKNNDMMFAVYVCAMVRCVLALHTLIFVGKNNEEKSKELEQQREQEKKEKEDKKSNLDNSRYARSILSNSTRRDVLWNVSEPGDPYDIKKFREIERNNLDRHSYEVQIKELTEKVNG
ncbi:uncharacterized protein LOC116268325 [Nymphaea colorata]|nr:uncharacterized protein LOC116268325 [Nymphaea colorata]